MDRTTFRWFAVFLAMASALPAVAVELDVAIGSKSVVVETDRLLRGDAVVFLAVSWPDQPWIPRLETVHETAIVEKNGAVALTWPGGNEIPFRTLVVAVNPRDGSYGVGTPAGFPTLEEELLDPAFVKNEKTGLTDVVRLHGRRFEFLVIRPGVGAWRLGIRDGSEADIDGSSDRVATVSLNSAQTNDRYGSPPSFLQQGDLVIAIDPRTMTAIAGGVS